MQTISSEGAAILNSVQDYKLKPHAVPISSAEMEIRGQSIPIAECNQKYGVSPKAIRDIWNIKTWIKATEHLQIQDHADTHACGDLKIGPGNKVDPFYHDSSDSIDGSVLTNV